MTIIELRSRPAEINELPQAMVRKNPDIKVNRIRELYAEVCDLESKAAKKWGAVKAEDIASIRLLLPEIEASLHRLEAGQARRKPIKKV